MLTKLKRTKLWAACLVALVGILQALGVEVDREALITILTGLLAYMGIEGARDIAVALRQPPPK